MWISLCCILAGAAKADVPEPTAKQRDVHQIQQNLEEVLRSTHPEDYEALIMARLERLDEKDGQYDEKRYVLMERLLGPLLLKGNEQARLLEVGEETLGLSARIFGKTSPPHVLNALNFASWVFSAGLVFDVGRIYRESIPALK
ncbi:MAG: hypothetical protein AAF492_29625 [Verrucomicrobiota bacterium]